MKTRTLALALAAALLAGQAVAQATPTLDSFVTRANRIPMNPTAMLHSDTRRLMREAETSIVAIKGEIAAARTAGRTPPACPPDKISVNPRQLLGYFNAIPRERRQRMSVTDGFRAWMADRYPCAA